MLDRRLERGVDLGRVVAAAAEDAELVVGVALDELEQLRVLAEEVPPDVVAGHDGVLLELAVHRLVHPLDEEPRVVGLQQRVPVRPPDHLDDVPAGAAEGGLELLDDLAVAAHRPVQALQVAVDDEDQVVEPLARGEGDGAEALRLVGLAVAEEGPDAAVAGVEEAAVLEVAVVARLVDGADRSEAHRDGRELPEVGHQPGVRVGGQAVPAGAGELAAEGLHLLERDAPFEVGLRVDPWRAVPLDVDEVAGEAPLAAAAEEVVEADLVERGRGGEGRDVAAEAGVLLVRPHHHRHGVAADDALETPLDLALARVGGLALDRDGVDVGGVAGPGEADALLEALLQELLEQELAALGPLDGDDLFQGLQPLLRLVDVGIGLRLGVPVQRQLQRGAHDR